MAMITEVDQPYKKSAKKKVKPTLLTAPVVLLAVVICLTGYSKEYRAERLYWHAERTMQAVLKDPAGAAAEEAAAAVKTFQEIVDKTPGTLSAAKAQYAIGSIYAIRKQYPQAKDAYEMVIRNYGGAFESFAFTARLALVSIYRAEGDHLALAGMYKEIMQFHPWTPVGLDAPLLLAADIEQQDMKDKAREVASAYQFAAEYYNTIINKAPTEALALVVKGKQVIVYQQMRDWEKVARTLQDLVASQSPVINRPMVLLALASVYESKLKETKKATELYAELAKNYADQPFGKAAAKRLVYLEKKSKSPTVPEEVLELQPLPLVNPASAANR